MATWQNCLGDEFDVVKNFLRPTDLVATSYPFDNEETGRSYNVIQHGPDDYVGVCEETGRTRILAKRDLTVYEVNERKLGQAICAAFDVDYSEGRAVDFPEMRRLGFVRPTADELYPTYLAFCADEYCVRDVVNAIVASDSVPFVFITPTTNHLTPATQATIDKHGAVHISLSHGISVTDGNQWHTTEIARSAISRIRGDRGLQSGSASSNGLLIDTATFRISFAGLSFTFGSRSKLLFSLLHRLSSRPGHKVLFDSLRGPGNVWDGSSVEDSTIRGAVHRLRALLRQEQLTKLASCISTGTVDGRPYVILDLQARPSKSN